MGEEGGLNLYGSFLNGPINFIDILGLKDFTKSGSCTRCHIATGEAYGNATAGLIMIGVGKGAGNMVVGTYDALSHPVITTKSLIYAIGNPKQTINAIAEHYSEKSQTYEGKGEILFDVLSIIIPVSAANKVSKISKLSNLAKAEKICRIKSVLKNVKFNKLVSARKTVKTPWGTRNALTGKWAKGGRSGVDPVDDFIAHAEASGFDVLGTEITVKTPFGNRRIDVVLKKGDQIGGVEIKSSIDEFNKFKKSQNAADTYMNQHGAQATGQNAADAGITEINNSTKILWE